jgi:hypothetical protein
MQLKTKENRKHPVLIQDCLRQDFMSSSEKIKIMFSVGEASGDE